VSHHQNSNLSNLKVVAVLVSVLSYLATKLSMSGRVWCTGSARYLVVEMLTHSCGHAAAAELSEHKMDILGLFPSDGELEVLSFLEPADLVACCLVSKRWRQLADSNELWRQQCARCWRDKQYISLDMVERHHNRYVDVCSDFALSYLRVSVDSQWLHVRYCRGC